MCFIYKYVRSSIRNNFFLIFGLFLGVGLSAFMSPIVQNSCIFSTQSAYSSNYDHSAISADDDYEPRINLAGKPAKAQKTPQEFLRPRYFTTELGIREKLFIAVLTSPKTIETYGLSFNRTINHLIDKVVFFMESQPNKTKIDVAWSGVVQFSDTRLILKPFHVLKYIADNYMEDFDYFYFVRDTTYVRGRDLYDIVQRISVSENVHVGGAKPDEVTEFCSLDAGVLLSNLVLQKVIMNLNWCIHNAFSDLDDSNLGRCIVHSTGLPCKNLVQGMSVHSYHFQDENLKEIDFVKLEKVEEFMKAITFWPVGTANNLYELHTYFSKVDLSRIKLEIATVRHSILNTTVILPPNNVTVNVTWPVGNQPANVPANRFDLLRWDYFNENQIFLNSDFSNVDDLKGADLKDIKNVINASVLHMEVKYEGQLVYKRLLNGYRRFDPARGMDYILDLAFKDVNSGAEVHKRVEVCKPLGKVELVPVPYVTENTRVNMIVIVDENNKDEILTFMENYATTCMEKRDKTFLMLVLLYDAKHPGKGTKADIYSDVKKQAVRHSDRFKKDGNKIAWLSVKLPDDAQRSRSREGEPIIGLNAGILKLAVLDLVIKKFPSDNLLLLCSSNMEIRQDYLNRVRMNTIKSWQVFSPIPFSEFNPTIVYNEDLQRPKELDINKNYGHYDYQNKDHISFYVKDYRLVRKNIEEFIPMVHGDPDIAHLKLHFARQLKQMNSKINLEKGFMSPNGDNHGEFLDTITKLSLNSIYSMFVNRGNLTVLRGVEPGLRLRHVDGDCHKTALTEDTLKSVLYEHCVDKRNFNAGTRSHLGHFILDTVNEANHTR